MARLAADFNVGAIRELMRKLQNAGKNAPAIVDRGLRQGAEDIAKAAQKKTEDNGTNDTGRLHGSIAVNKRGNDYYVGAYTEYAPYVEYGTGTKGDPEVHHADLEKWVYFSEKENDFRTAYARKPRPFLRPAFNENKDRIKEHIAAELNKELKGK